MSKEPKKTKTISISMDENTFERLEWMLKNLRFKHPNGKDYRKANRSEFVKSLINEYYIYIRNEILNSEDERKS